MPIPESLVELISRGESESVEFKSTIAERTAAAKTACAMLNTGQGGTIIFGVNPRGSMVGTEVGEQSHDRLRSEFSKIDPQVHLEWETLEVTATKSLIVIRVPGNTELHSFDGRPYVRFGASTSRMPEASYQTALLERVHSQSRWENQPSQFVKVSDLDEGEIIASVLAAIQSGRLVDPGTREPHTLLQGMHLIDGTKPLNAAAVLFGKPPVLERYYPQCRLRLARFRGITKSEFVDNKQFVGHLFHLYEQAQLFLSNHIPVAGRIDPNTFVRLDTPTYPLEALREALANALVHRDYAESGGAVDMAIYDDRLEITSTGPLHFGLTVNDLKRRHQSRLWNPSIANVLYRRGIIESWGMGTLKILELNQLAGLSPAEFLNTSSSFTVQFFADGYTAPTRVSRNLTELQRTLLSALQELGPSSSLVLAQNVSSMDNQRMVLRNLQTLRDLGLVETVGERRGSRWILVR